MSSLLNVSYGKILDYWRKKLSNNPNKTIFLITKIIEIIVFKRHSGKWNNKTFQYVDFPQLIANNVSKTLIISIITPTYIESQKDINDIVNLLQSISKQTVKPDNVIIIDDCSPISFSFPEQVQIYRQNKKTGPAKARNYGKEIALKNKSDIIAFTDTDCILSENWIETIIETFKISKYFQILSGNTISYDKNWFGQYHDINGTLNGRRFKGCKRLLYGTTANLAITRQVAENIDFSEKFSLAAGEDIEFCFRANQGGFAIKYVSQMVVFHNYSYTNNLWHNLKLFSRQFEKYGRGETILLKEIPEYYVYFEETEEITAI
ncbi:MAG: glycosyltransferase [Tannerellaceae bacterium]|jgi:GT2 family glycosyltransferase|nr:glycosyltransferase [Tannerellaceae bacterium]